MQLVHYTTNEYHIFISGWGNVGDGSIISNNLQKTSVPLVSVGTCEQNRDFRDYFKKKTMMCAGPHRGESCAMDTGGPLVCKGRH